MMETPETKSLLPSLCKREEFPLFGKEGLGEIFTTISLFNYGLLSNSSMKMEWVSRLVSCPCPLSVPARRSACLHPARRDFAQALNRTGTGQAGQISNNANDRNLNPLTPSLSLQGRGLRRELSRMGRVRGGLGYLDIGSLEFVRNL